MKCSISLKLPLAKIIIAARPPFLILAPICVFLGAAIAKFDGNHIDLTHLFLALFAGICAAIAVNTLNEYQDFHSGLDNLTEKTPFSGGSGLLPSHPELAPNVLVFCIIALIITATIGLYFSLFINPILTYLGVFGIVIIATYTKWLNRSPILCLIAPGVGFGMLMVLGSFLVQTHTLSLPVLFLTLIPFLLINNLLLLNQFPDIEADKITGRNHIPIKYGTTIASYIMMIFNLMALSIILFLVINQLIPMLAVVCVIPISLCLWSTPTIIKLGRNITERPSLMILNVISANLVPFLLALCLWFG